MKADHINPVYEATKQIMKTMVDLDISREPISVSDGMVPSKEANVVLGVTGDLKGSILFSFPKQMVLNMVSSMSGLELDTIDQFVSSAMGEIANIIGGTAVTKLSENGYICDITPPQIFIGEYKSISMASQKSIILPIMTEIGKFEVIIILKEK